ncbi:Uncharacterized protein APZ42_003423, partial [Daphnia magna]
MQRSLRNRRERPRADQHDVDPVREPPIPALAPAPPANDPIPAEPVPNPPVVPPFADYNQWTAEQRLRIIGMSFEGVVQKWYYGLMLRERPTDTFEALLTELFRAFKPVNYKDHLEVRLRSRQEGVAEPFTDYFHDVLYMCSRIEPNMSDRVRIQHLYRGLPPATVRGIYRFITPTSTTEEFFREVQVFLQGEDMASRRESLSLPQTPVYHLRDEKRPQSDSSLTQGPTSHSSGFVTKNDLEAFGQNLLNTGAEISVISPKTCELLNINSLQSWEGPLLIMANGTRAKPNETVTLEMLIGSTPVTAVTAVLPINGFDLLLGNNALRQLHTVQIEYDPEGAAVFSNNPESEPKAVSASTPTIVSRESRTIPALSMVTVAVEVQENEIDFLN